MAEAYRAMTSTPVNRHIRRILALAFWLLLWQLCALKVGKELILPGPFAVVRALIALASQSAFWINTVTTIIRIISGYLLGVITAVILAVLTCRFAVADTLISPVIRVVRATPVASFIILALLWMGKSNVPVLMAMLMVIPVVWENITAQYRATDKNLIEMAQAYRLSDWKKFRYIYVPSAFPGFLSGCLTAMGLAWKSGIAAEVLSQPKVAIGSNLYYSKLYLETPELFAWTAVVVILSMLIEKIIRFLLFRGVSHENK